MSTLSTGIQVSEGLLDAFKSARENSSDVRYLKVLIRDESLVVDKVVNVQGDWESDFHLVAPDLEENSPCYIVFRSDESMADGYRFFFLAYVPDTSVVRDKMLYASTRATCVKSLGSGSFAHEVYGNTKEDFTLDGFKTQINSDSAAAPMTEGEINKARATKEMSKNEISTSTVGSNVHGIQFPMSDDATQALKSFCDGNVNYVQLSLDVTAEKLELEASVTCDVRDLEGKTPENSPRFHFFSFNHSFEDNTLTETIFVYSCPMAAKVKERMLYSSSKSTVSQQAIALGLNIAKSSEISDANEFTEQFVFEELHPKKPEEKKTFKKPMRNARSPAPRRAAE